MTLRPAPDTAAPYEGAAASILSAPAKARLAAGFDRYARQTLTGWAVDLAYPGEPVAVHLHMDGEPVALLAPSLPRRDLAIRFGRQLNAGFAYPLPDAAFDGRSHLFQLMNEDREEVDSGCLRLSPDELKADLVADIRRLLVRLKPGE